MKPFQPIECANCGELCEEYETMFCSEQCAEEYKYTNRTCTTCGGEFWDGGHSCICDDSDPEPDYLQPEIDERDPDDDLPF